MPIIYSAVHMVLVVCFVMWSKPVERKPIWFICTLKHDAQHSLNKAKNAAVKLVGGKSYTLIDEAVVSFSTDLTPVVYGLWDI